MANKIRGIAVATIIIIWIIFICKRIENKKLKKYIKLMGCTLIFWIALRTIRYSITEGTIILRALWYLYYFPILASTTLFMNICTWNTRKKKSIKIFRALSAIGSFMIFGLVITNDLHMCVFKFDKYSAQWEREYTYGIRLLYMFAFCFFKSNI